VGPYPSKFSALFRPSSTLSRCAMLQLPHYCDSALEERRRGQDGLQCVCRLMSDIFCLLFLIFFVYVNVFSCGLYYKLHGSARPISMKSDIIRKRSRHDACRAGNGPEDTPSASPGVSRRTSPVPDALPTLALDSKMQMSYNYSEETDYRGNTSTSSELMGTLGTTTALQPFPTN
jgi:hypothetical protein